MNSEGSAPGESTWWDELSDEDRAFLKRFILASGSLKDLAAAYDVSYPTVRLRLDRVVQKIQLLDEAKIKDPFERALRAEYGDGKIEPGSFKRLLAAYRKRANPA